ncbi:hypothetical protein EV368DRAFT_86862 [Lentinula lateritia]|nr:hypothetical protein EV368DRAFT_86862 [Lentinula lateritia]
MAFARHSTSPGFLANTSKSRADLSPFFLEKTWKVSFWQENLASTVQGEGAEGPTYHAQLTPEFVASSPPGGNYQVIVIEDYSTYGGNPAMGIETYPSAKHVSLANHPKAAESTSQQPKHPEQVKNLASSAFVAGERSPASILALATIQVLQMSR